MRRDRGFHANGEGASVAWQEWSVRRDEVRGGGEAVPGVILEVEEGIPYQLDGGINGDAAVESSAESRGIGCCGKGELGRVWVRCSYGRKPSRTHCHLNMSFFRSRGLIAHGEPL